MIKSIDTPSKEYVFIETVCDAVYDLVCEKHNVYVCDITHFRLLWLLTLATTVRLTGSFDHDRRQVAWCSEIYCDPQAL